MKKNNLKIEGEEVENYAEDYIRQQLVNYMDPSQIDENVIKEQKERLMNEQKFVNRAVEELTKQKLSQHFEENLEIQEKAVTIEEFMELTEQQ